MSNFFKSLMPKNDGEKSNKKKIENTAFLVLILIITLIVINTIWRDKKDITNNEKKSTNYISDKILANDDTILQGKTELEERLENILSTIKNVGKVNVLINYSESSSIEALYNESTTTSSTEEGD